MPLPDLPPNNTARAWLKYTLGGVEHEMAFRLGAAATQADFIAFANAAAVALKSYIHTSDSFSALRYSNDGSNLSFPLAFTAVAGTNTTVLTDYTRAFYVALAGRSAGGYRCRVTFFTPQWGLSTDYRASVTGGGAGQALYNLVTGAAGPLVAIDGLPVVWNAYVNQGVNAYWQRELR